MVVVKKRKLWKEGSPGTPPRLGEKRADSKLIVVVTDEQDERISAAAKAAGKSRSAWARDILLPLAPPLPEGSKK